MCERQKLLQERTLRTQLSHLGLHLSFTCRAALGQLRGSLGQGTLSCLGNGVGVTCQEQDSSRGAQGQQVATRGGGLASDADGGSTGGPGLYV